MPCQKASVTSEVKHWSARSVATLQDVLDNVECVLDIIPTAIKTSNNQKLWVNGTMHKAVNTCSTAMICNDYQPVTLMLVVIKVFERHIKDSLYPQLHTRQPNRSTEDVIPHVLHTTLSHMVKKQANEVRLLFIDYSSAFNTTFPHRPLTKTSSQADHWLCFHTQHRSSTRMCTQPSASRHLHSGLCSHTRLRLHRQIC